MLNFISKIQLKDIRIASEDVQYKHPTPYCGGHFSKLPLVQHAVGCSAIQ
jgi:hypothetical protein